VVSVESALSGERSRNAVLVSHCNKADVKGWVIPAAGGVSDSGEALPLDGNPESWMNHPRAITFTLTNIFQTSRETMAEYIHRNIFSDTFEKYSAWMHKNERELDLLSRLDFPLPLYCMAPLEFVYNRQWNHGVQRLERRGAEEDAAALIGELYTQLGRFKILPDLRESATIIERIITRELAFLAAAPSSAICKRIGLLLDIVDRYKMPVSKHTLEDSFAPIMAGPVTSLNDEVERLQSRTDLSDSERKGLGEKKTLLGSLVEFAARMNFNTDSFPGRAGK
jgi:hypothetical protein